MNTFFWQAQRLAWKAREKAWKAQWKAERKIARAEARAAHPRSIFGILWGFMWGMFWIGLVFYWVFGGPEARQNLYQLFHAAIDTARNIVQDIAAMFGVVQ